MKFQSALVVGGAGFIGSHLIRYLRETKSVERIVSLDVARPKFEVPRVPYITHDIRNPIEKSLSERFDIVFNLAAVHRTPGHPDHEYYETNVEGAQNCVNYCELHNIKTLFFTSSISVYGPTEEPLTEADELHPLSAYGRSKRLAERIHVAWQARDAERRLRIARPAVVFGEGEGGNYTSLAHLLRRGLFVYPGRKTTRKAGGYVKELVRTMAFALERPEPVYLYNFADQNCPTAEEICAAFLAQGGLRKPLGVLPRPVMHLGAIPFEILAGLGIKTPINRARIDKLYFSTNIVPQRLIRDGYPFAYDLNSAISDWLATDPMFKGIATNARAYAPEGAASSLARDTEQGYAEPQRVLGATGA